MRTLARGRSLPDLQQLHRLWPQTDRQRPPRPCAGEQLGPRGDQRPPDHPTGRQPQDGIEADGGGDRAIAAVAQGEEQRGPPVEALDMDRMRPPPSRCGEYYAQTT